MVTKTIMDNRRAAVWSVASSDKILDSMDERSSRGRRPKPAPLPMTTPKETGRISVLWAENLLRFVTDCPSLGARLPAILQAWGVPCVPLPSDTARDVVAEVFGMAEQVHAIAAVSTANVGLQWHPHQPFELRPRTLYGFAVSAPSTPGPRGR